MKSKKSLYIGNIQLKILKLLPSTNKDLCVSIYGVANEITRNSISQSLKSLVEKEIVSKDYRTYKKIVSDASLMSIVREGKNFKYAIVPFQLRKKLILGELLEVTNITNNLQIEKEYDKTKRIQLKGESEWNKGDTVKFKRINEVNEHEVI